MYNRWTILKGRIALFALKPSKYRIGVRDQTSSTVAAHIMTGANNYTEAL